MNRNVEQLRKRLNDVGITNEEIKTSDYSIKAVSVYSRKLEKSVPDGYAGSQNVNIEIPLDKERMDAVLKALSSECSNDLSLSISFGINDTEVVRKQLLRNSVTAAKINAETIADAAGITLGPIVTIEYGWSEARFNNYEEDLLDIPTFCRDHEESEPVFLPNDLTKTDTVTVVYEIL